PPPPPTPQPPSQGPSAPGVGEVTATSLVLSWTDGNGDGRIVLAREGGDPTATPLDGTSYAPDSRFGAGSEIGSENFVVFEGDSSAVRVTDLTPGADYHFAIFEYSGNGADRRYQRGDRAQADQPTDRRAASLIGSWLQGTAGERWSAVFTALDESAFLVADDGVADGGGQPGIDRGAYQWDSITGVILTQPTTDTSGDWGLSHVSGGTVTVAGDTLTLRIGPDIEVARRVVPSPTNPLVGGWAHRDPSDPDYLLVVTFLDDQHWMLGVDDASPQGGPGMEQGTYTWDRSSGAFAATATSDTSGDTGLSPLNAAGHLAVRANLLIYSRPGAAPDTLTRVH
ncbi:MAG: hypothetical protein KC645_19440, partial [Gemmatimonadetes bacterium]|nr:hypothetical protein [Gemmatimonadota bacterium]